MTDKLSKLPLVNAVITMCSATEDEGDGQQVDKLPDSVPVESLVQDLCKMSQTSPGVIAPFSNMPSDATTKYLL